ncbi:LTA synthase family protein [Bacteroides faecium]|uniref:LTA synthase family protein n=1 Tax=Bacteroides faecium TaxID=2715212 RepID=A0A6H0KMH4_9BACE|nr:LTA synthase family protein [Bacteroides faecium]QIU93778.1 LTA synthase family protein [Bacteroides faecium]
MLEKRLCFYFLFTLCFFISLGQLCHILDIYGSNDWIAQVCRLGDAMLLSLPLFCRKKRIMLFYLLFISFFLLSIVWYFRTYSTIMPLSSYLLLVNLKGLGGSIVALIRWEDVRVVISFWLVFVFYCWVDKKYQDIGREKIKGIVAFSLVGLMVIFVIIPYFPNRRSVEKQPKYIYPLDAAEGFKEFGLVNYWIYQFSLFHGVSNDEKIYADKFIKKNVYERKASASDSITHKYKNLILILVESFQSWPIGLEVDGIEVTPYINSLVNRDDCLYFSNMMPQVKDGRSSDAQLIINTGLLPLRVGAASSLCSTNTFPSLPKALKEKGYCTVSFVCDGANYWNQGKMSSAYGFDHLYDRMKLNAAWKAADEVLFERSIPLLKSLKKPFYAQIVTIASHSPYNKPLFSNTPLLCQKFENEEVKYYLNALQYVDHCIDEFINNLKKEGLYDNSIIVITGDHEQVSLNMYEGRKQVKGEDYFIPFIVLNTSFNSKFSDKVIGQMDVYPSLLELMECSNYFWKGLGESVFGDTISDFATFRTGIPAGGRVVPDSVKEYRKECWRISDILLRMDYFKKE